MLRANCEGVLIAWKAMRQLRTNSCAGQWAHCVVVWSIKGVTFIIPVFTSDNISLIREKNINLYLHVVETLL